MNNKPQTNNSLPVLHLPKRRPFAVKHPIHSLFKMYCPVTNPRDGGLPLS